MALGFSVFGNQVLSYQASCHISPTNMLTCVQTYINNTSLLSEMEALSVSLANFDFH